MRAKFISGDAFKRARDRQLLANSFLLPQPGTSSQAPAPTSAGQWAGTGTASAHLVDTVRRAILKDGAPLGKSTAVLLAEVGSELGLPANRMQDLQDELATTTFITSIHVIWRLNKTEQG